MTGMSTLTVYTLSNCDTCRRATKWLRENKVEFVERAIRETPPSLAELQAMRAAYGGELRSLFNTAGKDYRELKMAEQLPRLTEREALGLLAKNGNLVKRPFLIGNGAAKVGFKETEWAQVLAH
jgi:arsenate reductase